MKNKLITLFLFPVIFYACGGGTSLAPLPSVTVNTNSNAAEITSFSISNIAGVINGTNISITVPFGTSTLALTPTIVYKGASISPASGVSQNFSSPVVYTVISADGSTKAYTVTVTVTPGTATKDITSFSVDGIPGTIIGTNIFVTVPYATNVAALAPDITFTGASINNASGVAQDFSLPVTYTVTAQDGSIKNYTVAVSVVGRWTGLVGGTAGIVGGTTLGFAITSDPQGNIYTSGSTESAIFDGYPTNGSSKEAAIVKYNSSGVKQWSTLLGVVHYLTISYGITTDVNGNVFVTGLTAGNLDGIPLVGGTGIDAFVAKYETNGIKQWTTLLGVGGHTTEGYAIAGDSNGNVYVTGYSNGNLDGKSVSGFGGIFVTKYDTNGIKQWTSLLDSASGGIPIFIGTGITVDSNDNIYAVGLSNKSLNGVPLIGASDTIIAKYDVNGTLKWMVPVGTPLKLTRSAGVSTDALGNIYISGYTDGNLDGETLTGSFDTYVSKYGPNGIRQWTRLLGQATGTQKTTQATGIACDLGGDVYVTGYTDGSLDGNALNGLQDAFVTKYDTAGVKQMTQLIGATGATTTANGITNVGKSGDICVTGYTDRSIDGVSITGVKDLFVTTNHQ